MKEQFKPFTFSMEVRSLEQLKALWLLSNISGDKMNSFLSQLNKEEGNHFTDTNLTTPFDYGDWGKLDDKLEELNLNTTSL